MKMHLASEVKLYSLFLITTAGCLLMLVSLFFMNRKLLVSKQWKVLVLQVFLAWWQLLIGALCFIATSWTTQEIYSLSPSPLCSVPLFDRQGHCVVIHCHTYLKGSICAHTQTLKWTASWVSCFHCCFSGYLTLQATQQIPVGILVHLPMPAGRRGTSKCVARCALPAQWDIHYTAQRRESVFPTGPGRADSHSANVREIFKMSLMLWM